MMSPSLLVRHLAIFAVVATGLLASCGDDDATTGDTDDAITTTEESGSPTTSVTETVPASPATTAPASTEPEAVSVSEPCDLTEPDVVASVIGGNVAGEETGLGRNCTYRVEGGPVSTVEVYYYGVSSEWEGIRGGYEDNRGPLTDVPGIGDMAFHPGDVGPNEVVVLSGDVVFAVGLGPADAAPDQVAALASRIADDVS